VQIFESNLTHESFEVQSSVYDVDISDL